MAQRARVWRHRSVRALFALAAVGLLCVGCIQLGVGEGGGRGSAGDGADGTTADGGEDAMTGVACGKDPATGVVLCAGVSGCPGLLVDQEQFPNCGFRPGTLDLQCLCNEELCPMGSLAKTCAEAKYQLAEGSQPITCSQLGSGTCKPAVR